MQTIRQEISFTKMKKGAVYVCEYIGEDSTVDRIFRFNGLLEMMGPDKFRVGYRVATDALNETIDSSYIIDTFSVMENGSFIALTDKEKFFIANTNDINMINGTPRFKIYNEDQISRKRKAILTYMTYGEIWVYDRILGDKYKVVIDKYLDDCVKNTMSSYYSIEEEIEENTVSIFQAIYDSNLLLILNKLDEKDMRHILNMCMNKEEGIYYPYKILVDVDGLVEDGLAVYSNDIR